MFSRNPTLIDLALALNISWKSTSLTGKNILHYAILSKCTAQIDKILLLEKMYQELLSIHDNDGRNILHYAAMTGDPETFNKILSLTQERGWDIKAKDENNLNALDYALKSDNQRIIQKLQALGLEASVTEASRLQFK